MNKIKPKTSARVSRRAMGGFTPISIAEYVKLHAASTPGVDGAELRARLGRVLDAKVSGARCHCGERIWALGSAEVGFMCFTCITGEAAPDNDYEVVAPK